MFRKIVVGYDGQDPARDALALGRVLAGPSQADLTAVAVIPAPVPLSTTGHFAKWQRLKRDQALAMLAEGEASDVGHRVVEGGSPAHGLMLAAEDEDADLIVVGSSHRGPAGAVLAGSTGRALLHGTPCPVAVAPNGFRPLEEPGLRVVGVGFDGSPESQLALRAAVELAEAAEATMRVVAVAEPSSGGPSMGFGDAELHEFEKESKRHALDRALDSIPDERRAAGELMTGTAALALREAADRGMDVLVIGSRGYGPLRSVLLGSLSAEFVRSAPCPVIAFPRGAGQPAHDGVEPATARALS